MKNEYTVVTEKPYHHWIHVNGKPVAAPFENYMTAKSVCTWLSSQDTIIPHDFNLKDLQQCLKPWVLHNFGNRVSVDPLIGICEETGELAAAYLTQKRNALNEGEFDYIKSHTNEVWLLCAFAHMGAIAHAHLKAKQGIRGTAEEHEAKKVKELSLMMYAMTKYFSVSTIGKVIPLSSYEECQQTVMDFDVDTPADAIADIVIYAADFCNGQGIDMTQTVYETWNKVKQRDFKVYPGTGKPPVIAVDTAKEGEDKTVVGIKHDWYRPKVGDARFSDDPSFKYCWNCGVERKKSNIDSICKYVSLHNESNAPDSLSEEIKEN